MGNMLDSSFVDKLDTDVRMDASADRVVYLMYGICPDANALIHAKLYWDLFQNFGLQIETDIKKPNPL